MSDTARQRLEEALALLEAKLPREHDRLMRDVERVFLLKAGGPEYWPFARAIVFKKETVERAEVPVLAMSLLHEGVHARLWAMGIGYPERLRSRIEQICVRAEVQLARALPDSADLEAFAKEKLEREWWTKSAVQERRSRARQELRGN
jgi:hypothetical protein